MDVAHPFAPADVIVLLTDLQPQIVKHSRTNPEPDLRRAAGALAEGADALGIPLIRSVIRLGPEALPEVIEELAGGPPLIRDMVGVFDHEESRDAILAHGRSTVVVGGVSTEVSVLHAVLGARRLGHPVRVLADVCGSRGERAERAAFRQMEAAGATLSSVASFLTGAVPDLRSPQFRIVLGLLSRLWAG